MEVNKLGTDCGDSQSRKPDILTENAGKIKGRQIVECSHQENTGMAEKENVEAREAKHGEKMIELKIRFWTDELCEPGKVIPKHALTAGVVRIKPNKAHGISPGKARPFNSLLDLGASIEKVLKEHGIVLHPSSGMRSYISENK